MGGPKLARGTSFGCQNWSGDQFWWLTDFFVTAHVYAETNSKIGALARVFTETNGGIEETLHYCY